MAKITANNADATVGEGFEFDGDTVASRDELGEGGQESAALEPGTYVGRYMILNMLGRGGMGAVYTAYDPELDRRVALKLLSIQRDSETAALRSRERLLREAQALAQLSHPNVVSAYDVGTVGNDVFMAMELVEGKTLQDWVQEQKPSIERIVAVMVAAGRGIVAAHKVGMIHRDIKPENILVGDDGRARVLDFGLARAVAGEDLETPAEGQPSLASEGSVSGDWSHKPITMAGAIMGTPGYMAPEQYLGAEVDQSSDQYSFCVTLYQMLYGARPHKARSYQEMKRKITCEPVRAPARKKISKSLRKIVMRGLSLLKEDRYPSMAHLLADLSRDPRLFRRRLWMATAAVILLGSGFGSAAIMNAQRQKMCQGAEDKFATVWNDIRRREVKSSFVATGRPYAEDTYARVDKIFGRYAQAWTKMRTEACEATHLHGEQSENLLDKRMHCLDQRLTELGALTQVFAKQADAQSVDKAIAAALDLTPLAHCADVEMLSATFAPPADQGSRKQLAKLRGLLATASALERGGKFAEGSAITEKVLDEAQQMDYPPIEAEAFFLHGAFLMAQGKAKDAEANLLKAARLAALAKNDRLVSRAMTNLIYVIGYQQTRFADALQTAELVEVSVIRAGNDPVLEAGQLKNLSIILVHQGQYQRAEEVLRKSTSLLEGQGEENLLKLAHQEDLLGIALFRQGRWQDALRYHQHALAVQERILGAEHPSVAASLDNMANVLEAQERYQEALKLYQRSLLIQERVYGVTHLKTAIPLNNISNALKNMGKCAESLSYSKRAVTRLEQNLGKDHVFVAFPLTNLGACLRELKRTAEALPVLERALALRTTKGAEAYDLAETKFELARVLWNGDRDRPRATELAKEARAAWVKPGKDGQKGLLAVNAWLREREKS